MIRLEKEIQKMMRKKNNTGKKRKENYILLGVALHSIQDYYAHCMESCDLEHFKIKVRKFKNSPKYKKNTDLKEQLVRYGIFTLEEVTFHSDWLEEDDDEREKIHLNNKDSSYAVVRKKNGSYDWDTVSSRYSNPRYINAINHSASYLRGTFW